MFCPWRGGGARGRAAEPQTCSSGADRFFRRSGRTTLVSIFETAKPQSAETIAELLTLQRDKLKRALTGTAAEPLCQQSCESPPSMII